MGATIRIGEGYDIHRLEKGRPMRIGCVEIPCELGPLGHSDGDVLAHALCDAILGALALGDIGTYFPSEDELWRGADSRVFLAHVSRLARTHGAHILNADATVSLERPRLAPHIADMRRVLSTLLACASSRISIKAKTADGLGPVGEGKAIEARAVVLLELKR
jgi:2-C-methyl-D-erythritol 2,4-cyclodiphosphate synthase